MNRIVRAQLRDARRTVPAWLVCHSRFAWKYGLGRVRPFALLTRAKSDNGYLKRANTIEELAIVLGVLVQVLMRTVRNFNRSPALREVHGAG